MSTWGDVGTVAAPTIVAVTALWFNNRQQVKSRHHDRIERQKEREHDQAMREAAERHERMLSDLDYQRRLVDDVATALARAKDAALELSVYWEPRGAVEASSEDSKIEDSIERVSAADDAVKAAKARMILRFGSDHQAIRVVDRAIRAMERSWIAAISHEHEENPDPQETESALSQAYVAVRDAEADFLALLGTVVGSAPDRD